MWTPPELRADDRHHLERVLRLRPTDALTVGDGAREVEALPVSEP